MAVETNWDEDAPRVLRHFAYSNQRNAPLLLLFEYVYDIVTSHKPMRATCAFDYRLA